jgi:hypothetical protein
MKNPRTGESDAGASEAVSRPLDCAQDTASPSDLPAQLRRRRAASWRCEPLPGGQRDPLNDDGFDDEPLTDAELDSWRAAWQHLNRLGLPALVPARVVAAGQTQHREVA